MKKNSSTKFYKASINSDYLHRRYMKCIYSKVNTGIRIDTGQNKSCSWTRQFSSFSQSKNYQTFKSANKLEQKEKIKDFFFSSIYNVIINFDQMSIFVIQNRKRYWTIKKSAIPCIAEVIPIAANHSYLFSPVRLIQILNCLWFEV